VGKARTPGPLRTLDSPVELGGSLGSNYERSAWQRRGTTDPTGFRDHRRPIRVADAGHNKVSPKLIIVDYLGGLSEKDRETVVSEVKRALNDTTRSAKDPTLKAKGVEVTSQTSLQGVDDFRRKGYILVYLIHDVKDGKKREKVVREILTAEGALKGQRLDTIVKDDASELTKPENFHDRASDVAFINLDLTPGRGPASLRLIAGNVIHEGIGHRAISAPKGEDFYHNPENKGVMSETFGDAAKPADVQFQGDERTKVNDWLQYIVDNPDWNQTPAEKGQ
jgi:hypothetical protein